MSHALGNYFAPVFQTNIRSVPIFKVIMDLLNVI